MVCFVLCLATFIFELIYMCCLKKTNTLQRLFLYLTFSTLLYVGVLSLHIEHFFRYGVDHDTQHIVCQAIGFLDQYTGSVQLMFTVGITVAIFNSLFRIICSPYDKVSRAVKPQSKEKRRKVGHIMEVSFIIMCFVLPALFAWIPFVLVPYGETGPWCWIEFEPKHCQKDGRAFLEQLLLWYVPFTLVSAFSFLCVIVILSFFVYTCCRYRFLPQRAKLVVKEMSLLFTFLLMLCVVCAMETIVRSAVNTVHVDRFGLWLSYAFITPIGGIVIPISFFVYFLYNKCSSKQEPQEMVNHPQHASEAADQDDGLIHPPGRVSVASYTEDRAKNFLTNSGETSVSAAQPLLDGWLTVKRP